MWKKVVAVLLVVPIAGLAVAAVKWEALGLNESISFLPVLVGQIIAAFIGFSLLGLANYLWAGDSGDGGKGPKP